MFDFVPPVPAAEVVLTNQYVRDGLAIADGAAATGRVTLDAGAVYVQAGATVADFLNGANAELEATIGAKGELLGFDVGATVSYLNYRGFKGSDFGGTEDEIRYGVTAARDFGKVTIGARYQYTDETAEGFGKEELAAVGLSFPAGWGSTVSGEVGQVWTDATDYTIWNVGATKNVTETVALDFRYYDNSVSRYYGGEKLGDAFVVSLRTTF